MITLSTGQDSTLENWIDLSTATFGKGSPATIFLEEKAAKAKEGIKAEVIAPESQVLMILGQLHVKDESS